MKKKNNTVQSKIRNLVYFATTDKTSKNMVVEIEVIKPLEAKKLKNKTGFELLGFVRIIDKSSINHTIKEHSDAKKESLRGQIPITLKDFEKIPLIVQTENIIYNGKNKIGNDVILYEKVIGDVFYYAEEVRRGKKKLCLQSMYKRKLKK